MSTYWPPVSEHEALIAAALRSIEADHYSREDNPHWDAEREYAAEQLALKARELARAVDAKPADEQPIGWNPQGEEPAADDLRAEVERLRAELAQAQAAATAEEPGQPSHIWQSSLHCTDCGATTENCVECGAQVGDTVIPAPSTSKPLCPPCERQKGEECWSVADPNVARLYACPTPAAPTTAAEEAGR